MFSNFLNFVHVHILKEGALFLLMKVNVIVMKLNVVLFVVAVCVFLLCSFSRVLYMIESCTGSHMLLFCLLFTICFC